MTDAIGGYFGLELRNGEHLHRHALRLNTGRNCLEYILRARGYKHIWLPYYTCEVLLEPLHKLQIPYSFYNINNNLEPETLPRLSRDEAFLYTNYYGLKSPYLTQIALEYGTQLIVDNAQAFFAPRLEGIDTFYTARKFFGVPDGAYLYTDAHLDSELPQDESLERVSHLLKRIEYGAENGFADYQQHEEALCQQPIKRMSRLTERILAAIDYNAAAQQRRDNFKMLHNALGSTNCLSVTLGDAVPMVYPYWCNHGATLREHLRLQRIYTPTFWPNTNIEQPTVEKSLINNLLPLPLDQRYSKEELTQILKTIDKYV